MINKIEKLVYELLASDDSGHGIDHIKRVTVLAKKFAVSENANVEIVEIAALLHDADDYKLFGNDNAEELTNANKILDIVGVSDEIRSKVTTIIKSIGYNKYLKGVRPTTLEGCIVSDADMCDALGVNGILRTYAYSLKKGRAFFDKDVWPIDNISADKYTTKTSDSSVCHMFEKILKLKSLMLTNSGKSEAISRHEIVVQFLYHLFEEENAPEWTDYLNEYNSKYNS